MTRMNIWRFKFNIIFIKNMDTGRREW